MASAVGTVRLVQDLYTIGHWRQLLCVPQRAVEVNIYDP